MLYIEYCQRLAIEWQYLCLCVHVKETNGKYSAGRKQNNSKRKEKNKVKQESQAFQKDWLQYKANKVKRNAFFLLLAKNSY